MLLVVVFWVVGDGLEVGGDLAVVLWVVGGCFLNIW